MLESMDVMHLPFVSLAIENPTEALLIAFETSGWLTHSGL